MGAYATPWRGERVAAGWVAVLDVLRTGKSLSRRAFLDTAKESQGMLAEDTAKNILAGALKSKVVVQTGRWDEVTRKDSRKFSLNPDYKGEWLEKPDDVVTVPTVRGPSKLELRLIAIEARLAALEGRGARMEHGAKVVNQATKPGSTHRTGCTGRDGECSAGPFKRVRKVNKHTGKAAGANKYCPAHLPQEDANWTVEEV